LTSGGEWGGAELVVQPWGDTPKVVAPATGAVFRAWRGAA